MPRRARDIVGTLGTWLDAARRVMPEDDNVPAAPDLIAVNKAVIDLIGVVDGKEDAAPNYLQAEIDAIPAARRPLDYWVLEAATTAASGAAAAVAHMRAGNIADFLSRGGAILSADTVDGLGAVRMTTPSSPTDLGVGVQVPCVVGGVYAWSETVRNLTGAWNRDLYIQLLWRDSSNASLGSSVSGPTKSIAAAGKDQTFTASGTAPSGAVAVEARLRCVTNFNPPAGAAVALHQISVVKS